MLMSYRTVESKLFYASLRKAGLRKQQRRRKLPCSLTTPVHQSCEDAVELYHISSRESCSYNHIVPRYACFPY